MIVVDGEALGSILHSALTQSGKPKKSAEKQPGVVSGDNVAAVPEPEQPKPEPVKAPPVKATPKEGGSR